MKKNKIIQSQNQSAFEKVRSDFRGIIKKAINSIESTHKKYIDGKMLKSAWGENWFYYNHYWFLLNLNQIYKENLKKDYENVTAILIKPYRITVNDVEQAKSDEPLKQKTKFHNQKNMDRQYDVVYDPKTANFHKNISIYNPKKCTGQYNWDFQLILANNESGQYGPGWGDIKESSIDGNLCIVKEIKNNWYFPKITDAPTEKCDTAEDLANLINEALNEIYE